MTLSQHVLPRVNWIYWDPPSRKSRLRDHIIWRAHTPWHPLTPGKDSSCDDLIILPSPQLPQKSDVCDNSGSDPGCSSGSPTGEAVPAHDLESVTVNFPGSPTGAIVHALWLRFRPQKFPWTPHCCSSPRHMTWDQTQSGSLEAPQEQESLP